MLHTQSHSRLRRHLLAVAALLTAPAVVLATPGTASAAETGDRADAAAGWLGRQLDGDTHLMQGQFGADYGLTADVVLALDSAKVGRRAARQATGALRNHVLAYTGGGDPSEHYAGSYAKLVLVAAAQGADATAFGGGPRKNLVAGLLALECGKALSCAAADRGRFEDVSGFGEFSSTFSQSLALIGLERATSRGPSHAAVSYLIGQQCGNGGFPETFGEATCRSTVDATGFAVQALAAVGGAGGRGRGR